MTGSSQTTIPTAEASPPAQAPVPSPEPVRPATTSATNAVETTQVATRRSPDARIHVVEPGESLWSIATNLLGPRASTASIAGEVARLWRLNRNRIGTGDPNRLPVGVTLRLR